MCLLQINNAALSQTPSVNSTFPAHNQFTQLGQCTEESNVQVYTQSVALCRICLTLVTCIYITSNVYVHVYCA